MHYYYNLFSWEVLPNKDSVELSYDGKVIERFELDTVIGRYLDDWILREYKPDYLHQGKQGA